MEQLTTLLTQNIQRMQEFSDVIRQDVDSLKEFRATQTEILKNISYQISDHEKRMRFIEKACILGMGGFYVLSKLWEYYKH